MKKKVIGIAAGLILLAAAGGYAGVGHYYASHFFPKTAINGLNCAGLTAEQVKEEIQKHIVDYTLGITERGGKTETLSGTEIGLTYVDDHAVEKLFFKSLFENIMKTTHPHFIIDINFFSLLLKLFFLNIVYVVYFKM